jgi:hypothetical protein
MIPRTTDVERRLRRPALISRTVDKVPSWVVPPAPNVTEKNSGLRSDSSSRVARSFCAPSSVFAGKNSKLMFIMVCQFALYCFATVLVFTACTKYSWLPSPPFKSQGKKSLTVRFSDSQQVFTLFSRLAIKPSRFLTSPFLPMCSGPHFELRLDQKQSFTATRHQRCDIG